MRKNTSYIKPTPIELLDCSPPAIGAQLASRRDKAPRATIAFVPSPKGVACDGWHRPRAVVHVTFDFDPGSERAESQAYVYARAAFDRHYVTPTQRIQNDAYASMPTSFCKEDEETSLAQASNDADDAFDALLRELLEALEPESRLVP